MNLLRRWYPAGDKYVFWSSETYDPTGTDYSATVTYPPWSALVGDIEVVRTTSGTAGPIGPAGPAGPPGADGIDGVDGADGADGADALWNFTGAYGIGTSYAVGDIATYEGETWYRTDANGGNVGDTPSTSSLFWTLLAQKGDPASGPAPSDADPQTIGTASAGTSAEYSRADHVHAAALSALSDVTAPSPTTQQVLKWGGSAWSPSPVDPYSVGPAGSGAAYTVVQDAVDAADAAGGGVVTLLPGSYAGNVSLKNGVWLQGAGRFDRGSTIVGSVTANIGVSGGIRSQTLTGIADVLISVSSGTGIAVSGSNPQEVRVRDVYIFASSSATAMSISNGATDGTLISLVTLEGVKIQSAGSTTPLQHSAGLLELRGRVDVSAATGDATAIAWSGSSLVYTSTGTLYVTGLITSASAGNIGATSLLQNTAGGAAITHTGTGYFALGQYGVVSSTPSSTTIVQGTGPVIYSPTSFAVSPGGYVGSLIANSIALQARSGSSAITALQATSPSAGKLAYFTGTETASLTDITTAGREIISTASSGAAGQVLTSSGGGAPTWTTVSGGGGTISGTIAANEVAFGTGADTVGGSANFEWNNSTSVLAITGDADDCITVASVLDGPFLAVSPTAHTLVITDPITLSISATIGPGDVAVGDGSASGNVQAGLVGVTDLTTATRLTLTAPAGLATLTAEDAGTLTPTALNVVCDELQLNGSTGTAGQVLTSGGAGVAPTWEDAATGGGTISGTIAADEIAVGTGVDSIGGDSRFLWNTTDAALEVYAPSLGGTNFITMTATPSPKISASSEIEISADGGTAPINLTLSELQINGSAGTEGQVLTRTGVGTSWVTPSSGTGSPGHYGVFYDSTSQSIATAYTPKELQFDTLVEGSGITVANNTEAIPRPTRITAQFAGTYNIQLSAQLDNSNSQDYDADIWFRLDGVDVPNSNSQITVPSKHGSNHGNALPAFNFVLTLEAGQYVEIMWAVEDISVTAPYYGPWTTPTNLYDRPSTPSIILSVTQVMEVQEGPQGPPGNDATLGTTLQLIDGATITNNSFVWFPTSSTISVDSVGTTGLDVLASSTAADARTALELGTAATQDSTAFQAANANLTAITTVTPSANKLVYYTGATTADTTDLTTAGKEIISTATSGTSGQYLTSSGSGTAPTWTSAYKSYAQVFTSNGTWNKPADAVWVDILLIGGGGGGGSGAYGVGGNGRYGGSGGGGGAWTRLSVEASKLLSSESVVVGTGGAGGAAVSVAATSGNVGVSGGTTSVGTTFRAGGGAGGSGGSYVAGTSSATQSPGSGGTGWSPAGAGGAGTVGSGGGVAGSASAMGQGAGGGGGGGGISSANAAGSGASGGTGAVSYYAFSASGLSGGIAGVGTNPDCSGGDGAAASSGFYLGGAGGGSGSGRNSTANGTTPGDGGDGGLYGGGGGGGGATNSAALTSSGAGGAGANGVAVIITYCGATTT